MDYKHELQMEEMQKMDKQLAEDIEAAADALRSPSSSAAELLPLLDVKCILSPTF